MLADILLYSAPVKLYMGEKGTSLTSVMSNRKISKSLADRRQDEVNNFYGYVKSRS